MIATHTTIAIIFNAFLLASLGFTYSTILTEPGEIFSGLYKWLGSVFGNDKREIQGKGNHPIFKMIIGCHRCVTGQMALWFFVILNYGCYTFYHIIYAGLLIGLSILFAETIKKIYTKWK